MHYYLGDSLRYAKQCMENDDREYAAEVIERMRKELLDLKVNDTFDLGHYFLCGGSDPVDVKVHSPIIWKIIDRQGSKLLLISEEPLYWNFFDGYFRGPEWETSWEKSTLRKELNSEKYDSWFTDEEKKAILETTIIEDGREIKDRLFILSKEECLKYFKEERDRVAITRFADKPLGDNKDYDVEISFEAQPWWLRTVMEDEKDWLVVVTEYGDIDDEEGIGCSADEVGVRPAMWVDVERLIIKDLMSSN